MGHVETISPHEVQRMSAGKGVMHSEFNHEQANKTHLLQIWIEPDVIGIAPSYEQTYFSPESKRGCLKLVAAPDGRDGAVKIHANSFLYAGLFNGSESAEYILDDSRMAYVHIVRGEIRINGKDLMAGDALKIRDESTVLIDAGRDAEILLFDLPKT
jgi:redox-sensitive bicupin YhaK (pirin superfamily)